MRPLKPEFDTFEHLWGSKTWFRAPEISWFLLGKMPISTQIFGFSGPKVEKKSAGGLCPPNPPLGGVKHTPPRPPYAIEGLRRSSELLVIPNWNVKCGCYCACSVVPCHHAASDLMQQNTTVSSIGSAYTSVKDFIDVTWNTDDVWHLRVQYKCEQCERTNDFATRRQRYLSPLPGAGWILIFAENPRFFFVLFSSPVFEIFPRRPDANFRVFRKSWGVDGLSASAASRKIE